MNEFTKPNTIILNKSIFDEYGFFAHFQKEKKGKAFSIYMILVYLENRCGITTTTINVIMKKLNLANKYKKDAIYTLNILKQKNIIDFEGDIDEKIDINEILCIKMLNPIKYTLFDLEDFKLIHYLELNVFTLYCYLKSYLNEKEGYAFPKFENIKNGIGFSNDSIDKYNTILSALGLIRINNHGYKIVNGKPKKSNNEYYFDKELRKILLTFEVEKFKKLYNDILNKYKEKGKEEVLRIGKIFREKLIEINIKSEKEIPIQEFNAINTVEDTNEVEKLPMDNNKKTKNLESLKEYIAKVLNIQPDEKALDDRLKNLKKDKYSDDVIKEVFSQKYDEIIKFISKNTKDYMSNETFKINSIFKIFIKPNIDNINKNFENIIKKREEEYKREINQIDENLIYSNGQSFASCGVEERNTKKDLFSFLDD